MIVVPIGPDGSYSYTSTRMSSVDALESAATLGDTGHDIAVVILPNALITLSGPAVTPKTAPAIVRALRPL
jgi:hypothetical protein